MNMEYRENELSYEDYYRLRESVQLIAEKGKEPFYECLGFKTIPHEFCGSGMRRVIYKN